MMVGCILCGGAAGAATSDPGGDEPDVIDGRDCFVDPLEGAEPPVAAATLSPKLQAARARRQIAVSVARPKLVRLIEEARKNGEATGPIADWIQMRFKRKPTTSFLLLLNSTLAWGEKDAGRWVEPPSPRPDCKDRLAAVAERGGTTVWLCDSFYQSEDDEAALTLFHEAQHLSGVADCPGITTPATPVDQRLCAGNYEAMLKYLWRQAP